MRVYVASTLDGLRVLRSDRALPPGSRGVAVTPGFRESYASGDTEELEYAALTAAAAHSLALGGGRRVVLACEVADATELDEPGEVVVPDAVPLRDVKAVHIDDPEVDLTDPEGWELMWFATQELDDLLG